MDRSSPVFGLIPERTPGTRATLGGQAHGRSVEGAHRTQRGVAPVCFSEHC